MATTNAFSDLSKQVHEWNFIELLAIFFLPFLAFVTSSLLVVLLYEWSPWTTLILLVALFLVSMALAWRGLTNPMRPVDYYVGAFAAIALVLGLLVGVTAFQWYFFPYYLNAQYNSFTHVLPSNPSEGYADAGKIIFVEEARVESQLSMGYKDGGLYCVAPVIDEATTSEVGFWAVGQDCCSSRGNFVCDDAWNTDARAAIVVRKDDSFFGGDTFEHYMKAVRQAEAAYEIIASANPVFVRWVLNPTQVQGNYQREGFGLLAVMWAIYFVFSILATFYVSRSAKTKKRSKGPEATVQKQSTFLPTTVDDFGRQAFASRQNVASAAPAESGHHGPGNTMALSDPSGTRRTPEPRNTVPQRPGDTRVPSGSRGTLDPFGSRPAGPTDTRRTAINYG